MAVPLSAKVTPPVQAGLLTFPPFQRPSHPVMEQWHTRLKGFPYPSGKGRITATGSSPIFTGFPIKLFKSTCTLYSKTKNKIEVNNKVTDRKFFLSVGFNKERNRISSDFQNN
jgi:hypothetical protein